MMKKLLLNLFLLLLLMGLLNAQSVVVSEAESTADASALLDVQSTSKGMLIPRMTQAQRELIATPGTGLLVYQTDGTSAFYFFNGAGWIPLLDEEEEDPVFSGHPANEISNAGSGEVITSEERTNLGKAILSDTGFPAMTYDARNMMTDVSVGTIIYQTDNTAGLRVYNGTDWELINPRTAFLKHREDSGVGGGNSVTNDWQVRKLNRVEGTRDFVNLDEDNNEFQLSAGTYEILAQAPGYATSQHQIALYSGGAVFKNIDEKDMYGTSAHSGNNDAGFSYSTLYGTISIDSEMTFTLQHYTRSPVTEGLGLSYAVRGTTETYTTIRVTKIAD